MSTQIVPDTTSVGSSQKSFIKDVSTGSAKAEHFLQDAGQSLVEGLAATREAISESSCNAANATHDYVRTNPWKIIGIAAALGLLIGAVTRRR